MKKQIISIVGPTATGKTKYSLQLIEVLKNGYQGFDIISADSRQVYKGLEIVSGADVPPKFALSDNPNFTFSFFEKDQIRIHGISILSPSEDWSVAQFQQFALPIIRQSWQSGRLPLIVGGTGLYHQHLFNNDPKLLIKPNAKLRKELEPLSLSQLQDRLKSVDEDHFNQLNNSDVNNPVRLVRAIEISDFLKKGKTKERSFDFAQDDSLVLSLKQKTIGLKLPLAEIEKKIKQRVINRIEQGAIKEVEKLLTLENLNKQVMSATGVKEIIQFINKEIDQEELINLWLIRELQYAKRQLTWWKKRDVEWIISND